MRIETSIEDRYPPFKNIGHCKVPHIPNRLNNYSFDLVD